jgi:hypothetical protein
MVLGVPNSEFSAGSAKRTRLGQVGTPVISNRLLRCVFNAGAIHIFLNRRISAYRRHTETLAPFGRFRRLNASTIKSGGMFTNLE